MTPPFDAGILPTVVHCMRRVTRGLDMALGTPRGSLFLLNRLPTLVVVVQKIPRLTLYSLLSVSMHLRLLDFLGS